MKRQRSSGVAFLLSLITPGLGHLYSGFPFRGICLFCGQLLLMYVVYIFCLPTSFEFAVGGLLICGAIFFLVATDSSLLAMKAGVQQLRPYQRWYVYLLIIILTPFALSFVLPNPDDYSRSFRIVDTTMAPTLLPGDLIVVDRKAYLSQSPKRGDVVVYKTEESVSSKDSAPRRMGRVIGLPGEKVGIRESQVFIDNRPLTEADGVITKGLSQDFGPVLIAPNSYFVLADVRNHGKDSRHRDNPSVPVDRVIGKALYILLPGAGLKRIGSAI